MVTNQTIIIDMAAKGIHIFLVTKIGKQQIHELILINMIQISIISD